VSDDGHFLVQPDGKPFFWLQDWGYELFKMPDRDEIDRYLKDRSKKGFNVIMAPATGMTDPLTRPNRYGELPFIDKDPLRPNPRYFEHVDWVIKRAADYGLRIALLPSWGSPVTGDVGTTRIFDPTNAHQFGFWLASRYKGKGILWVLGGDTNPLWPKVVTTDPLGAAFSDGKTSKIIVDYRPVYDAFANGILNGSGGSAFITYHPTGGNWPGTPRARTSLYFGDRSWLDMNMIQSGHHLAPELVAEAVGMESVWNASFNYEPIKEEYDSKPVRPVIDGEPRFENEAINLIRENGYWKAYDVRSAAYKALFAGAAGVAYADVNTGMIAPELRSILLDMTPQQALASPGSGQMQHAKALMLSRPYFTRIPDQSVIVGDAGRGAPHITATRDRRGSYAMIYLPHGQKVTVNLSKISGEVALAWWFDPRTGHVVQVDSEFPTSGARVFEPPSSGADVDWILVLDDKSQGFPPPGGTS